MGVVMHKQYQSPLGKIQAKQIDQEKIKKQAFENDGILVININDERLNWPEKEIIKQIGNRIYKLKPQDKNGN